jgi:hypothetical protein
VARPIPALAPVTMATFPVKRSMVNLLISDAVCWPVPNAPVHGKHYTVQPLINEGTKHRSIIQLL